LGPLSPAAARKKEKRNLSKTFEGVKGAKRPTALPTTMRRLRGQFGIGAKKLLLSVKKEDKEIICGERGKKPYGESGGHIWILGGECKSTIAQMLSVKGDTGAICEQGKAPHEATSRRIGGPAASKDMRGHE